jgi:hypothetical protein
MIKSDLRKLTAQLMDARNQDGTFSSRWDFAANGEVDQTIGRIQDQEWRTLLDANPYLSFEQITAPTDSSGRVAKTLLDTGTGNTAHRHYRLLGVELNGIMCEQVRFTAFASAAANALGTYVYYERGGNIQILPALNAVNVIFSQNYLPTRQELLSADSTVVNFPDGFEDVLALEAGAQLLLKGGAETEGASALSIRARERRIDMLSTLSRVGVRPVPPIFNDSPFNWGV